MYTTNHLVYVCVWMMSVCMTCHNAADTQAINVLTLWGQADGGLALSMTEWNLFIIHNVMVSSLRAFWSPLCFSLSFILNAMPLSFSFYLSPLSLSCLLPIIIPWICTIPLSLSLSLCPHPSFRSGFLICLSVPNPLLYLFIIHSLLHVFSISLTSSSFTTCSLSLSLSLADCLNTHPSPLLYFPLCFVDQLFLSVMPFSLTFSNFYSDSLTVVPLSVTLSKSFSQSLARHCFHSVMIHYLTQVREHHQWCNLDFFWIS